MKRAMPAFPVLIFLLLSLDAWAAGRSEINREASRLMDSGNGKEAYQFLLRHHDASQATAQQWFLLGMAAKAADDRAAAVGSFEQALRLDPHAHRIRLELAEATYKTGDAGRARQLLLDVKATNPPQQVVQNIDRFLSVIEDNASSTWRVRGQVGWLYDSNVNQATSSDTVRLFGLPFVLSDDARPRSDSAWEAKAEVDHVARLDPHVSWQSNLSISWRDYSELDDYDSLTFNASTGPVWRVQPQTLWSMPLFASGTRFENGHSFYSATAGAAPQVRLGLSELVDFNLQGTVGWKHFHANHERDGLTMSVSPSIDIRTGSGGTLSAGLNLGRDESGLEAFASDSAGVSLSYVHQLSPAAVAILYGSYSEAWYKEMELAYDEKRHDERATIGGELVYRFDDIGTDFILSGSYTNNASNLELYEHHRYILGLSARKQF